MKLLHFLLLSLFMRVLPLYGQPPEMSGNISVRKKQDSITSETPNRVYNISFSSNSNSTVTPMNRREPRYKGDPYVGKAEDVVDTIISRNKKDFHYKYLDNALLLYGNFETNSYELYEVKSTISQKLYMYYEYKWFELKQNSKKSALAAIDNSGLVNYLNKEFLKK